MHEAEDAEAVVLTFKLFHAAIGTLAALGVAYWWYEKSNAKRLEQEPHSAGA